LFLFSKKSRKNCQLFRNCRTIIYCRDHADIHQSIRGSKNFSKTEKFTWSLEGDANLVIKQQTNKQRGIIYSSDFNNKKFSFSIPFSNKVSVENALHCFAVMVHLGCEPEMVKESMAGLVQVEMRLELKKGINDCTLVNDSYNSDMGSLEVALDFLNQLNQHKKKTLILSDIFQTGLDEKSFTGKFLK
jgi:Alr-MurF fusion protein